MTSEIFSEKRMDRCQDLQRLIIRSWQQTNEFSYIARLTEPTDDLSLDNLRNMYFCVGIKGKTKDIPFLDMLVVLDAIRKEHRADQEQAAATPFSARYSLMTDWPDQEALLLLREMQIQNHDGSKFLEF